ncbi:TRAFAC clade GTPase domain-containing protein [Sphingobacterium paludis]|uniref:Double-GTPase 1 domain-containing protein n=1 Tax=Sphingobacterium paludis TaxID=1476465 RepID=A0A4R7CYX9_9SPHI|nr:hypothetical protein [Sphingobacterium paludis]TDS12355.1 hypothetical protein B0I21_106213 [Sphingobacterium paludis]
MNKHKKQHILSNCNSVPLLALDQAIVQGFIAFEELEQHGLKRDKLKELQLLDDSRNGKIVLPPPIPGAPIMDFELPAMPLIPGMPPMPSMTTATAPMPTSESLLEKIKNNEVSADDIKTLVTDKKLTFDYLEQICVEKRVVQALKFYSSASGITIFKKIEDLPPMESGRTDLYMVGMPFSGKSTILASLIKHANKQGILMHDSYNPDGNKYLETLKRNLDYGILPIATEKSSYNYIATSLKDPAGTTHPFNIVEVPGENYVKIFNQGVDNSEIPDFIDYVKSNNKKILIFVIDALSHDRRFEDQNLFSALDQSIAYTNIISIFKDAKVLENTDAVYFVVNKFDYIKQTRYLHDDRAESELALDYMNQEFLSLIENCKTARVNSRNQFKIKILPFSIGSLVYEKIVTKIEDKYPEELVKNMLEDSFVVKGGAFWKRFS